MKRCDIEKLGFPDWLKPEYQPNYGDGVQSTRDKVNEIIDYLKDISDNEQQEATN